jgi:predicted transcriptional regulator
MELRLEPELAAKVEQWAAETGRPANELIEDALRDYFDGVEELRTMLNTRLDDIASGRVEGIPGDEAIRMLREKAAAREFARTGIAADEGRARG